MNSVPTMMQKRVRRSPDPQWATELEHWRRLLGECRQKPSKKCVHALRVATLRLQAQITYWINQHGSDHPATAAAKKWNKQAKHLRRALGAVREFDVYLGKLSEIRATLTTPAGYEPHSSRASLRQINELERRFTQNRRTAAKALLVAFEGRHERIERAVVGVESELDPLVPLVPRLPSGRIDRMFGDAVSWTQKLDAESLHDFRKQIKNVRYLAELMARSDPGLRELAITLKAMQGAVGEWHDWDGLAKETAGVFDGVQEKDDLTELLKSIAEESLAKALRLCENAVEELLLNPSNMLSLGKPVQRAELPKARTKYASA